MGVLLAVSMATGLLLHWRQKDRVATRFLDPDSREAQALLVRPVVVEAGNLATGQYTANYRDVRWLFSVAQANISVTGGLQADFDNDRVTIQTANPVDLKRLINEMQRYDHLDEHHAVVRGVAVDQHNRPVPHLPVDLTGPARHAHYFRTRGDGSFSVPVEMTPGTGYALRFRRSYARSYMSMPFRLGSDKREVVVKVIIPQDS